MAKNESDDRDNVVQEATVASAQAWAQALKRDLAEDGRRITGGWPGTLTEARSRAGAEVGRALWSRTLQALTSEELSAVARNAFREARRVWNLSENVKPLRKPAGKAVPRVADPA